MHRIQFTGRAMARLMLVGALALSALTGCGQPKSPYVFSSVTPEVSMTSDAVVDVRLVHEPSGKPIEDAVIFEARLDMEPEGMADMTAETTPRGSPAPGLYRFAVKPTMAGRWKLTLGANVQGESEPIHGSVVVTAH